MCLPAIRLKVSLLVTACIAMAGVAVVVADDATPPEPNTAQVDFFERHIRPVLAQHCYECHSQKSQDVEGGLRLDSLVGLLAGGDSGKLFAHGKPEQSLLLSALRYDALEMPPKGKLPQTVIDNFARWIRLGAPHPSAQATPNVPHHVRGSEHWSFQPVARVKPPPVMNKDWATSDMDRFILRALEQHEIAPAPQADRRTLIRRAYFDLVGLPPTPQAVVDFVADDSPLAFRQLVNELLQSPHYGERWGRYWLDVARYADNKGYVFYFEKTFPWAWAYRDYVVRAFNEDLPYDRFVTEQIAADKLDLDDDLRPLTALGFLTVGPRFTNNTHDILDDRIDVVTRGLQGLTYSCARCHDHKYDPMTQADYYALYGIFRSSFEPLVLPEFSPAADSDTYRTFQTGLRQRETKLNAFVEQQRQLIIRDARQRVGEYLMAAHYRRRHPATDNFMLLTDKGELTPLMVQRWEQYLKRTKIQRDPVWSVWHAYAELPDSEFVSQAEDIHKRLIENPAGKGASEIHPDVRATFSSRAPRSMREVARGYAELFANVRQEWENRQVPPDPSPAPTGLDNANAHALWQVLYSDSSPANLPREFDWGFLQLLPDRPTQAEFQKLLKEVEQWTMKQPGAPPRAMVLHDRSAPFEPYLFVRGNPNRRGPPVQRCVPPPIAGKRHQPISTGSGRLELAQAIASRENPLTARVLVNRIWRHHFGQGLVLTPSDFGLRSQAPSHPELLDWLANDFMEHGWSIKHLHRRIMNSSVYQQQSQRHDATTLQRAQLADPDNRLLWKSPRRRLDFEAMRDTLLDVAGALDQQVGGPSVNVTSGFTPRRSIYGFVDRMNVSTLLRTFDFPEPTASSSGREQTTVPPQALYFLNNDFIQLCAQRLLARPDIRDLTTDKRITRIYMLLFGRHPNQDERALAHQYLTSRRDMPSVAEWKYGYGELDKQQQRTRRFTELTTHIDGRWQGGPQLPDPKLGWVFLDQRGGHPGETDDRCCIRRWTAPGTTEITITGLLAHKPEPGNGVRARIVSSRHGVLGEWRVDHSQMKTEPHQVTVQTGDTIDFVVDAQGHITHDEHEWTLRIESTDGRTWESAKDFRGNASNVWVDFAHALLMTNEFVFID